MAIMDINSTLTLSIQTNSTATAAEKSWSGILVASTMSPIIVLGGIGNILSLLVWVKIRRCKNSTACFLAGLAIADLFALLVSGTNFWMSNVMETDVRNAGIFLCKLFIYVDFTSQFSSAWIIVLVTTDRAIAVWCPYKYKLACRPVVARVLAVVTVFAILLMCLPFLISADIIIVNNTDLSRREICVFADDTTLVENDMIWFYAELSLHFAIPFIVIIISNSTMLMKAVLRAYNRRKSPGNLTDRTTDCDRRMLKNMSVRIVGLSVAFCLGVGPIHLYGYKETLQFEQLGTDVNFNTMKRHSGSLYIPFVILMYLNNGINFYLYCLIGSGFRNDLLKLFSGFRKSVQELFQWREPYPVVSV